MKNKWRILKILVTVIIFGFLLSFSLKRFNNAKMDNISINMIQGKTPVYFIDEKDIKELVKQYNPTRRIGDVNIPELEKRINDNPFVDSANVYMSLNGHLNVDIVQRVPVFRLNKGGKDFYVDAKGVEFPTSKNFSHPCMLVTGDIQPSEYQGLKNLIEKIENDEFCQRYFIGIKKEKNDYQLLTSEGNYKVEIGNLEDIDVKVKGFKTFVEKYLVYQDSNKYKKISVKYDNQIVTTLNPYFKENDSILRNAPKIEVKKPVEQAVTLLASAPEKKKVEKKLETPKPEEKASEVKKKENKEVSRPKETVKKTESKKVEKKKESSSNTNEKKKKTKVIIE